MILRPFAIITALLAVFAAACGDSTSGDANPGASNTSVPGNNSGSSGDGVLIYSSPLGIVEHDLGSGTTTTLVASETNTFLLDPSISRDGNLLVYTYQPPPDVSDGMYDAGSDIWVANRDGSDARPLFEHEQPNQLLRYPRWHDADHILAVVPEIVTQGGVTSVSYTLQRINVRTLERTQMLDNVLTYAISPDGSQLAYARFAGDEGETLGGYSIADNGSSTLVGAEHQLAPFYSIEYSPDGSQIAFSSADQTQAPVGVTLVSLDGGAIGPPSASFVATDGLPQDIWTIDAAGSPPRRVADLKEDLPTLTWSGDGSRIYVLGAVGLYEVNLENGTVNRIGEGVFHGQVTWAP